MQEQNLVKNLLSYRLHWYRLQMFEKLIRFKHVVIIIMGLFIAPLHLYDALFVQPIIGIGYGERSFISLASSLVIVQLIYLSWIILQGDAIIASRMQVYLRALPISSAKQFIINLVVLLIANNILWIPILSCLLRVPYSMINQSSVYIIYLLSIMFILMTIIGSQLQHLNKQYINLILVLLIDIIFGLGRTMQNMYVSTCLVVVAMIGAIVMLYPWQFKIALYKRSLVSSSINGVDALSLPPVNGCLKPHINGERLKREIAVESA